MSGASVFYKFKSARTPSRITFDGSGISVWDLKRQIMLQNRMGKGTDFDLAVCSAETEEGKGKRAKKSKQRDLTTNILHVRTQSIRMTSSCQELPR